MIIECISCSKKFSLNKNLMPEEGSKVRCGSCSEVWFYHPTKETNNNQINEEQVIETSIPVSKNEIEDEFQKETIFENTNQEMTSLENKVNLNEPEANLKKEKIDFKIFTNEESEPPSKEEMDRNLDQYKIDRDNNLSFFGKLFKKDRLKESEKALEKIKKLENISEEELKANAARRTRFLFYLLVVLIFAASVLLVPLKEDVIMAFPILEEYINFLTPIYNYIKEPLSLR